MTRSEFMVEIAGVLNEDPAAITPETALASLEGWDSTGLLGVIAVLDGSLQVQVDVEKLRGCQTMADLIHLVEDRLN